jgi:hypothetical protein
MKKKFLPALLISTLLLNQASAQSNKAFAITSETKGSYNWTVVRELDLATGNVLRTLFNPADNKAVAYESVTGARIAANANMPSPTYSGVAAAAYDSKHNRLYFSQMWMNELRYFDLNSNETKVVINTDANYSTGVRNDESNVITRMTFGADGNGYALTNDGNQLIRFTTGDKPVVTNLGSLIDSKNNNGVSVHTQCTSWGGDMVADVYGNLYLITFRSHVFKINIQTRIAEHIGVIKNLPATFTANGAAVDANGDVFISSAVNAENYYKVNLSTLDATVIDKKDGNIYNASDLANSNLAYQAAKIAPVVSTDIIGNNAISIYPNPAVNKTFSVQFQKVPAGAYTVELTDANGRKVLTKNVSISGLQNENMNLPKGTSAGLYLIKVISNATGKSVYNDKVVVQ